MLRCRDVGDWDWVCGCWGIGFVDVGGLGLTMLPGFVIILLLRQILSMVFELGNKLSSSFSESGYSLVS